MITGTLNERLEAIVSLDVHGPTGQRRTVDAIVDTGYSGFLTLPPDLLCELSLPPVGRGAASLADGSEVEFDIFRGRVSWDGSLRLLDIDEADTTPLLGTAMLEQHDLHIEFEVDGRVVVVRR